MSSGKMAKVYVAPAGMFCVGFPVGGASHSHQPLGGSHFYKYDNIGAVSIAGLC